METFVTVTKSDKSDIYREIIPQIRSLIQDEPDLVANLANTSSVLKMAFPSRISWVGFYLMKDGELVLGPFQGKPACARINIGKGVCGAAASSRRTVIVPDVNEFPGHIACDPESRSEIVVPVLRQGRLLAVLDLDSSRLAAFDVTDARFLEEIASIIAEKFS